METKHTPGPWTYSKGQGLYEQRYVIDSEPGRALAVCAGFEPRNEANARLIAAAPDLLDALIEAEQYMQLDERDGIDCFSLRRLHAIRAAIAKATGETL